MFGRKKANTSNFLKQAEAAGQWEVQTNQMLDNYQREFPGKMSRNGDEVLIEDMKHFEKWRRKKGYNL